MKTQKEKIKEENDRILEKMRNGESLSRCKPQDTWFQPRPIIEKDKEAIKKLEKMSKKDEPVQ